MIKVVSGGQTGVDRVALDVAIETGLQHGGWCPLGRRAEDGVIPDRYALTQSDSRNYAVRTQQNIVDSDGTLVFFFEKASGGTSLTIGLAKKLGKPILAIGVSGCLTDLPAQIIDWIGKQEISVLNVAGPRLSSSPELPDRIRPILKAVLESLKSVG